MDCSLNPCGYPGTGSRKDRALSVAVCCMLASLFLINSASVLKSVIGIPASQVSGAAVTVLLGLLVINVYTILRRMDVTVFAFLLGIVSILLVNWYLARDNEHFMPTASSFVLNILPLVVVVMVMKDTSVLTEMLVKTSRIVVLLSAAVVLMAGGNTNSSSYSMGFANSLVVPVLMMIYDYHWERRKYKLLLAGLGGLAIVALGSRGALLGIAFYIVFLLCRGLSSTKHKTRSYVLIALIVLAAVFFEPLLNLAAELMNSLQIKSRTVNLLLSDDSSHSSGRAAIYDRIIREIRRNPFRMHGIAGEYAFTRDKFFAHNFILELLCDFGVAAGGAAVLWILWHAVKSFIGSLTGKEPELHMIFMAASLPVLLVSGTIWESTYFWLWFALILSKGHKAPNNSETAAEETAAKEE